MLSLLGLHLLQQVGTSVTEADFPVRNKNTNLSHPMDDHTDALADEQALRDQTH